MTAQEFRAEHGEPTTWSDYDYELYWLLTESTVTLERPARPALSAQPTRPALTA
ncbi:hypothetical protein [Streptomyces sp. NBC_01483]|uniref:hypothetical protein n=1 Tax=Streptomyces sp. NBC_01483 TaxID=2903883 RepID=UPI002E344BA0|nr:hypothetical protein [Streptomyces sp. NBC_01483]